MKRFNQKLKNQKYQTARVLLIPQAEAYANELCGKTGPIGRTNQKERIVWSNKWNLAFHSKMDELVRKSGLMRRG